MVFGVHVEKSDQLQQAGTRSHHRHKKPYLPGRSYFRLIFNNLNEKFQYTNPRENYRPLYFRVVFGVHPPVMFLPFTSLILNGLFLSRFLPEIGQYEAMSYSHEGLK